VNLYHLHLRCCKLEHALADSISSVISTNAASHGDLQPPNLADTVVIRSSFPTAFLPSTACDRRPPPCHPVSLSGRCSCPFGLSTMQTPSCALLSPKLVAVWFALLVSLRPLFASLELQIIHEQRKPPELENALAGSLTRGWQAFQDCTSSSPALSTTYSLLLCDCAALELLDASATFAVPFANPA
jgi:hypothetical protein